MEFIPVAVSDFDATAVLVFVDDAVPVGVLLGETDTDGEPVDVFDIVILDVLVTVKRIDFVKGFVDDIDVDPVDDFEACILRVGEDEPVLVRDDFAEEV
jgi:hypothetical protein